MCLAMILRADSVQAKTKVMNRSNALSLNVASQNLLSLLDGLRKPFLVCFYGSAI